MTHPLLRRHNAMVIALTLAMLLLAQATICHAQAYVELLAAAVSDTRGQLPSITSSAQEAAQLIAAGGHLYAAGPQADFVRESHGRASGLMCIRPLGNAKPVRGDVVLFGRVGALDASDRGAIHQWQSEGAKVIAFASHAGSEQDGSVVVIDSGSRTGLKLGPAAEGKICPIDSVMNVVNLWAWTGEFAAACTRLGKMPVFYKSYGLPGGRERASKYSGVSFHTDMKIAPIDPGTLGNAYLDAIYGLLDSMKKKQIPLCKQAADWWRAAGHDVAAVYEDQHMIPKTFLDDRAPHPISFTQWVDKVPSQDLPDQARFIVYLGYRDVPPAMVAKARLGKANFVYITVIPADLPAGSNNILYINSLWPTEDGCVPVSGYDVPILPASGVMNSAVYWTIIEKLYSRP